METKDYRSLCIACLCPDRKLKEIHDINKRKFYDEILSEINVYNNKLTLRVCWECEALLKWWEYFKKKAKFSYQTLIIFLQQDSFGCVSSISQQSRLSKKEELFINIYPETAKFQDCELKDDIKPHVDNEEVKFEPVDLDITTDNDHYEDIPYEPINCTSDKEKSTDHIFDLPIEKVKKEKKKKKKKQRKKATIDNPISDDEAPLSALKSTDMDSAKVEVFDEKDITLVMLSPEEMVQERDRDRLDEYYLKSPFKCEDCIAGFLFEHTFNNHLQARHSERAGRHVCSVCKCRYESAKLLEDHSVEHTRRFKCLECGKKTGALKPMVKHVKNHKEHVCDKCGLKSSSLFRHQAHLIKAHKEKSYCGECKKHFSSRKTYRYHFNVMHKGENSFACPHCAKVYQWKSNLWRHMKNHKARETGELVCHPCERKFSSVATYQMHLKSSKKHVTEADFNYICGDCGRKYPTKSRLKDHVNWEHLKRYNYRCARCDKVFKSGTSLYVHAQNVHKDKGEKDNLCHVCGKSYQNTAKLKYHIVAVHTTETPYSCNQCSSSFSWYSSLYRHIKELHHKDKSVKDKEKNMSKIT